MEAFPVPLTVSVFALAAHHGCRRRGQVTVRKEVTIQQVAQAAEVSATTVSRILNDRPDVSPATRERVQRVMDDFGYVPRTYAQSLAAGRSHTIALLFPLEHANATQLELSFVLGAARAAEDGGFYFSLVTSPMSHLSLDHLYRSAQVDGTIIMQVTMEDWRVGYLLRDKLDFVMIGRTRRSEQLSYVDFDFRAAVTQMYRYLHDLGHRNIGFISRPEWTRSAGVGSSVRLYEGFEEATGRLGLPRYVRETERTPEAAGKATVDLLNESPNISAIVTTHGHSTVGVLRAAQAAGCKVPGDLSVVTIASLKTAEMMSPRLTAVDFPPYNMGYEAAAMLIRQALGAEAGSPQQKLFSPDLYLRESVIQHRGDGSVR